MRTLVTCQQKFEVNARKHPWYLRHVLSNRAQLSCDPQNNSRCGKISQNSSMKISSLSKSGAKPHSRADVVPPMLGVDITEDFVTLPKGLETQLSFSNFLKDTGSPRHRQNVQALKASSLHHVHVNAPARHIPCGISRLFLHQPLETEQGYGCIPPFFFLPPALPSSLPSSLS